MSNPDRDIFAELELQMGQSFTEVHMDPVDIVRAFVSGALCEFGDNGGEPHILIRNTTPTEKGTLYLNSRDEPVYGFFTKFDEGFEGWQPGHNVRARFQALQRQTGNVSLLVCDSYVGDIRHADSFDLGNPDEKPELQYLLGLGMAEIDATVTVTGDGKYSVSNMFDYPAKVAELMLFSSPGMAKHSLNRVPSSCKAKSSGTTKTASAAPTMTKAYPVRSLYS
jgi:hypothetical protein